MNKQEIDERDAAAWAEKRWRENGNHGTPEDDKFGIGKLAKKSDMKAFLAGREGMIPMENVEILERSYRAACKLSLDYDDRLIKAITSERERCAHSADLMQNDLSTGETWEEALKRHKHRILNPLETK